MSEKITVEIDAKWVRRVKSPFFWSVSAFIGVSLTFAPWYLYRCGKGEFPEASWWLVPACFTMIYFVPLIYVRLAGEVMASILRQNATPKTPKLPRMMGAAGRLVGRLKKMWR